MSTETRPHPPSVELVLAAVRARVGDGASHEAIVERRAGGRRRGARRCLAAGAEPRADRRRWPTT